MLPDLPQLPMPVMAQANSQPLPEAVAPAKRVKPEPQDECSPSATPFPPPPANMDCLGEPALFIGIPAWHLLSTFCIDWPHHCPGNVPVARARLSDQLGLACDTWQIILMIRPDDDSSSRWMAFNFKGRLEERLH